jgi:hypothetical protein
VNIPILIFSIKYFGGKNGIISDLLMLRGIIEQLKQPTILY